MKKSNRQRNLVVCTFFILTVFFSMSTFKTVNAQDVDVKLILSESNEKSPAIFDGSDPPLCPGSIISKKFDILNKTGKSYYVSGIKVNNFNLKDSSNNVITDASMTTNFCDKVKCRIKKIGWINNKFFNSTIYEGSLNKFISQNGISINDESLSISNGGSKKFEIEVEMDTNADNTLQGVSGNLDIQIVAISKDAEQSTVVIGGNTNSHGSHEVNTSTDNGKGPVKENKNKDNGTTEDTGNKDNSNKNSGSKDNGSQNNGDKNSVNKDIAANNTPVAAKPASDEDTKGFNNLVKTGSFFDTTVLVIIGSLTAAIGIIIGVRKGRKE